jgi:hypothetical protein
MFGMNQLGNPKNPGRIAAHCLEQLQDVQQKIKQDYVGAFLELCLLEAQNNKQHWQAISAKHQDAKTMARIKEENRSIIQAMGELYNPEILESFSQEELAEFQEGLNAIYEETWREITIKSSL